MYKVLCWTLIENQNKERMVLMGYMQLTTVAQSACKKCSLFHLTHHAFLAGL